LNINTGAKAPYFFPSFTQDLNCGSSQEVVATHEKKLSKIVTVFQIFYLSSPSKL